MAELIRTVRGALLFDTSFYSEFNRRNDVFVRGVVLVVLVSLIAGIPAFIIDLATGVRGAVTAPAEANEVSSELNLALEQMGPLLQNLPEEAREEILMQFRQGLEMGVQIGAQAERLPTILPRPIGRGLQALGAWLSRPFAGSLIPLATATLGTWLGYGIWAMLAAKLLHGRSDLPGFLGTTSLYAVPHLLNVFSVVPVLGPLVSLIAFGWGFAIYVKATTVSHEMTLERGLLAVLLPALLALVILVMLVFVVIMLIGLSMAGQ